MARARAKAATEQMGGQKPSVKAPSRRGASASARGTTKNRAARAQKVTEDGMTTPSPLPPSPPASSIPAPQSVAPLRDALYFDAKWYLAAYPDVAQAGVDAATHYRLSGFREGRRPNAFFDGQSYREANPDLATYEGDLFLHYVFFGASEGRPLGLSGKQPGNSAD